MAAGSRRDGEREDETSASDPTFTVELDGFEGPLDLLLELARRQKVDLARISILELADQYLGFIEAAREVRLELAADYLVMAAWLAYLKSRLLLPVTPRAEPEDAMGLADALSARLRRLEQIRRASERLMNRDRLGRDVFARGAPEAVITSKRIVFEASFYDLIAAYARQSQKRARLHVRMKTREVWSLADAREALTRMLGASVDWVDLESWLTAYGVDSKSRRSARASSFAATLELVREGLLELRQEAAFAPLYMRSAPARAADDQGAAA